MIITNSRTTISKSICHIISDSKEIEISPLKLDYFGEMNDSILSLRIHQKYKNTIKSKDSSSTKAYLILPNTLSQSITGIECMINGKKIDLKVEENNRAKEIEKLGELSGCMTIRSEISQDEQFVKIILGLLPYNSECDITLHMEIVSSNSNSNTLQTIIPFSEQILDSKNFTFSININQSIKIESISIFEKSELKTTDYTFDGKCLKLKKKPICPIVLTTELNGQIPSVVINDINNEYSIVQIYPQFSTKSINSDFVFIVDCSGSMAGSSIRNASECLSVFMHSLPVGCNFNIIMFGSQHKCVFDSTRLVEYNKQNLIKADIAIKNLKADMGGTNLYEPLFTAYKQIANSRKKGNVVQIFLITDGMIHDKEKVFKLVRKNRSINRIFSLGIGNEVDKDLISGLATISYGKYDLINASNLITDKVINLLSLSLAPALTDLFVHSSEDESLEIIPNPLPPIFDGIMMNIYIKKSSKKPLENILITGNIGNEQTELIIDQSISISKSSSKKLFASNAITDYENIYEDGLMKKEELNKIKQKIIQLSIETGIPSKFTSFVGVDKSSHILKSDELHKKAINYQSMFLREGVTRSHNRHIKSKKRKSCVSNRSNFFNQNDFDDDDNYEMRAIPPPCGAAPPPPQGIQLYSSQMSCQYNMPHANQYNTYQRQYQCQCFCNTSFSDFDDLQISNNEQLGSIQQNDQFLSQQSSTHQFTNSFIGVISSQEFDGKWNSNLLGNLEKYLFTDRMINNEKLNQWFESIDVSDGDMKSTIVALLILHKFFSNDESKWKLIQFKAINWLNSMKTLQWEKEIIDLLTKL